MSHVKFPTPTVPSPLWKPEFEHDNCGVGFVAQKSGRRSYDVLDYAITALKNLAHRGAIDADAVTGDGAGVLTQIPHELFRDFLEARGKKLFNDADLGVCMAFLPREDEYALSRAKAILEDALKAEGLTFLAWRDVPVNASCLGLTAERTRPNVQQGLVAREESMDAAAFERALFLAMKKATRQAAEDRLEDFYIVSCSSRTITYKGLLNAPQLRRFYLDLRNPKYTTAFALFHQRFATNTLPDWTKAQPFRMMAHNGEINTLRGNRNAMRAREYSDAHGVWGERYADLRPLIDPDMSDSASFDNALQFINVGGRSAIHTASMMMPSSWEKDIELPPAVRDFYHFHSVMCEPWDGPAAVVFTDGRFVAAGLDRNGLRPLRYKELDSGFVICGSEVGLSPHIPGRVIRSGRLGPGHMIAIDIAEGKLLEDGEIQTYLGKLNDYGRWVQDCLVDLNKAAPADAETTRPVSDDELQRQQVAFGYDTEERELILLPMVENGQEPIGSMGDDTPLAVLSRKPRLLYTYFKQLFAQVTNPAIDPIRESLVMSTNMYLGGRLGLFEGLATDRKFLELESPFLLRTEFEHMEKEAGLAGKVTTLSVLFNAEDGPEALEAAVLAVAEKALEAVQSGSRVLVLSDRGLSAKRAAVPMLLVTGAVHHALVQAGKRMHADIVCETGEARDVHQMACLLGFGANAIYPYLALDVIRQLVEKGEAPEGTELSAGLKNYRKALDKGLMKIMSKMGISALFSYHGAQIFEALGISQKVVDTCFFGTPSPIGGIGFAHIAEETLRRHAEAYGEGEVELGNYGYWKVDKSGQGELHGWNPKVVSGMNRFVRKGEYESFSGFREAANEHEPIALKDLLRFRTETRKVALEEVEGIEEIRKRFTTAGMSLGALSPETHECLAIAMNRIGGKSNSGEGGEDPRRFTPFENGDIANSAIKQVASGRFGVTAEYLANASEIEIKIAQGAKPGEGGQLPGHKVSGLIARLRYSVPGVTLISPPPHHDIYSIEDLAQLIFDLKEVNPRARVCVKLVACSGVGTVAAGVAKAYADVILVSGHDGGTGASPLSSIKHAGSDWAIGLAEAHQVLMMNGLRGRVTLRTDGGMKTGADIVKAALLGAEEFNFGTAALIAAGCAMFRVCHLNSCPVGVATQREDLRAKFKGKPENLIHYFNAVSEDVRRILADLGARNLEDVIGRTDLLEQVDDPSNPKTKTINLGGLLHNPDPAGVLDRTHVRQRNDSPGHEGSLDHQILQEARYALHGRLPRFHGIYAVRNTHRNIGTRVAGEVGFNLGNKGLKPGTLDLVFKGSAGQSFGAFLVQGMRLTLVGDANDYVGKGMNGGEIIVHPKEDRGYDWHQNILLGNTCLYGATGGLLLAAGRVGERFGVRNSGGTAVIEGTGDHCCEYMTGGTVVVLGPTGRNFGAGMSGGLAFVLDEDGTLEKRINPEMVELLKLDDNAEIENLKRLIGLHAELSHSPFSRTVLDQWAKMLPKFWRVTPKPSSPDAPKPVFAWSEALEAVTV